MCVCVCVCMCVCVCLCECIHTPMYILCTQMNLRIMEYVCQDTLQDLVHLINITVWIFPQCTYINSNEGYFSFGG